jgi:hypothetical protein
MWSLSGAVRCRCYASLECARKEKRIERAAFTHTSWRRSSLHENICWVGLDCKNVRFFGSCQIGDIRENEMRCDGIRSFVWKWMEGVYIRTYNLWIHDSIHVLVLGDISCFCFLWGGHVEAPTFLRYHDTLHCRYTQSQWSSR